MNKIDIDKYKRDGVTKYITGPDENGYVFKYFKKNSEHIPYSFEKQSFIIDMKKEYIGKFLPETQLIKREDGSYYIKQEYIEGRLLKFVDINQLDKKVLSDLLELFEGYIAFCKNEGIQLDVFGYQEDIYHIENIRKKRFLHYTRMLNSFLSSTNIMISNDNKVYMIDVCDTIPVSNDGQRLQKIKRTIRKAIIELGIKRTEHKIRHIIDKKRDELVDTLS